MRLKWLPVPCRHSNIREVVESVPDVAQAPADGVGAELNRCREPTGSDHSADVGARAHYAVVLEVIEPQDLEVVRIQNRHLTERGRRSSETERPVERVALLSLSALVRDRAG